MDGTVLIQRHSLFMLSIVFQQKKDQASRNTPPNSQSSLEFHVLPLYLSLSPPCALFLNGIVLSRILCYLVATVALEVEVQCLRKWFFERSITLKLSAKSSSLLHMSLNFFLPDSLGELKPSCSILNSCLAVAVLLRSSASLGRY